MAEYEVERHKSVPMLRVLSEVAAGHASRGDDAILLLNEDAETPKAVLKRLDEGEFATYDSLWNNYEDDAVLPFVPKFEGVCEVPGDDGTACKYLRMTNLLKDFRSPKVMDIKLGIRTFVETECDNPRLRPDLYQRMLKLFPSQVTEEDRKEKGITKLRWMTLRDTGSTVRSLGFRIDGIAGYRRAEKGELDEELARLRQRSEVCEEFCTFAKVAATDDGREPNGVNAVDLAERLLDMLQLMHSAFENSAFVKDHECIGSSVLLVADAYGKAGVFWIDFGKTRPLPPGMQVTHRSPWVPGNHEDGILTGLDNMVLVWGDVMDLLHRNSASTGWRGAAKQRSFSGRHDRAQNRPQGLPSKRDKFQSEDRSPSRVMKARMVKRFIPSQAKLERSRTSPHHGHWNGSPMTPPMWQSESCSHIEASSQLVLSEPLLEIQEITLMTRVYTCITDRLCGICGLRRPKQTSQC
uniref:Kinase n=1 Tax=Alexandrium monilatum TaxID=311494 RepID=A0A7S4W7E6_9DINO|mmetsp:Transcript_89529/g.267046  ORF Transcript_89529/g.267046 Transcript_89529/m.267046 type:complete len:466 (+) Transcript_89529:153-1550(+)